MTDPEPEPDGRLSVRWQAFRSPQVGLLPATLLGHPSGGMLLVLTASGSTKDNHAAAIDLMIGNGPPAEDARQHVLEVALMLHTVAAAIEAEPDVCAAALADTQADQALAVADAEHAGATSEPPC